MIGGLTLNPVVIDPDSPYTEEQQYIIERDDSFIINAVAGSGKTTTICAWAQKRETQKIQIITYNKSAKIEVQRKILALELKNVMVATAHGLAYDIIIGEKNVKFNKNFNSGSIVEVLKLRDIQGKPNSCYILGTFIFEAFNFYLNSTCKTFDDIAPEYFPAYSQDAFFYSQFEMVVEKSKELFNGMIGGKIAMTHDVYLKQYWLTGGSLKEFDAILFDEGQDASPVMLDIFMRQTHANRIIVGDEHQQIYGWRYAINALNSSGLDKMYLSGSFRFGERVAEAANKFLGWKEEITKERLNTPPLKGLNTEARDINNSIAFLARTNIGLFETAIHLMTIDHSLVEKIHFEGGFKSYKFSDSGESVDDIIHLFNGDRTKIVNNKIRGMKTFEDLKQYVASARAVDLGIMVKLVETYGGNLERLIKELEKRHVNNKEDVSLVLTTAHKSKGMEYQEVVVLGDFHGHDSLKHSLENEYLTREKVVEELNLLYVAATRSQGLLWLHSKINPFPKDDPLFFEQSMVEGD